MLLATDVSMMKALLSVLVKLKEPIPKNIRLMSWYLFLMDEKKLEAIVELEVRPTQPRLMMRVVVTSAAARLKNTMLYLTYSTWQLSLVMRVVLKVPATGMFMMASR